MGLINYTPAFNLVGHEALNRRAQSIVLTDSPGYTADTLKIVVNMEGKPRQEWPRSGDNIALELGWLESGLVNMGKFVIAKVKPLYLPKRAEITATSAPFNAKSGDKKMRQSHTYSETTLGEIVQTCADRLGMSARVHPDLSGISLVHVDQKNETDLSFLHRLATKYDAVVKPVDGHLVFSRRGQSKTLSGQSLEPVQLQLYQGDKSPYNALVSVGFVEPERDQFLGVRADWFDEDAVEIVRYQVGEAPFKQLPGRYKTSQSAIEAATGELSRMARQGIKVTYTVPGNPLLMAEGTINLTGFDEDHLNGPYSNDRVTHSLIPGQSYQTQGAASVQI